SGWQLQFFDRAAAERHDKMRENTGFRPLNAAPGIAARCPCHPNQDAAKFFPLLVKTLRLHYFLTMSLKRNILLFAAALGAWQFAAADTVQLKDKAAITGKILTEKSDSVAVDVGYTVLVVPRNAITKVEKANDI